MRKLKLIMSVFEILVGAALCVCNLFGLIDDFWSGFGVSFIIIGTLFLLRNIKYFKNEKYREEVDIQSSDERNKYLSLKAWSWAGYLFVMVAAVGTIIFKLIGKEELMMLSSGCVCIVVFLYWLSYIILRRKY